MRYLITGHTGFKGAWLAAILKAQGHELVGISLPPLDKSLYKEAKLSDLFNQEYFIDIRNREEFKKAIKESGADVAFHLAAQPLVRESYKFPIETYETNVIGTLNFLEGVKNSDISAAVVITTDKVYKNKNLLRGYSENDELGGFDPYSSSKAAADIATQSWISSFSANNVAIARAGNVVGGGDWGVDRLMPDLIFSFIEASPAKIRYPEAIRPWQHVLDCLFGYLSLSEKMLGSGAPSVWNFGPEIAIDNTVAKVADLTSSRWGASAQWVRDSNPNPHEAGYLLLDSSKARAELGWYDRLDFTSTLEWTVDFYKAVSEGCYDPAFAYEVGHIFKDGLRRMYGENSENIYYYITVYNEPYLHPEEPANLDVEGLLKGIYLFRSGERQRKKNVQILASGVAVNWATKAQELLQKDWGVSADVWSVTSWNELRRDGLAVDRHNLLNPSSKKSAYLTDRMKDAQGPVIAVSDYMRTVQDQIAPWIPQQFSSLGTDGFGLSDTRGALRRHFKVDAESIVVATLAQLAKSGDVKESVVQEALNKYRLDDISAADPGNTEGSG